MDISQLSTQLGAALRQRGLLLVTAESCTGGWVAEAVTSIAGSSEWFERGFVSYSNLAKQEMLGVSSQVLTEFGAVSEQTAVEMANGALRNSRAQLALAITGIAGPGGGSLEKPIGLVCFAWALEGKGVNSLSCRFDGDRELVRKQAVVQALQGALDLLDKDPCQPKKLDV